MWDGMERHEDGNSQLHIQVWWIKIRKGTLGARDPSPIPDHPGKGSSTRSPLNFCCKNQWRLGWQRKLRDSQETLLKGPTVGKGSCRPEGRIQHEGNSRKGTSGILRESEVTGIKVSARRPLPPTQLQRPGNGIVPLSEPSPPQSNKAVTQVAPTLAITKGSTPYNLPMRFPIIGQPTERGSQRSST